MPYCNCIMSKLHQQAHDALGRLMHSDEITDTQAVEIQQFLLRMHGMMREKRDLTEVAAHATDLEAEEQKLLAELQYDAKLVFDDMGLDTSREIPLVLPSAPDLHESCDQDPRCECCMQIPRHGTCDCDHVSTGRDRLDGSDIGFIE